MSSHGKVTNKWWPRLGGTSSVPASKPAANVFLVNVFHEEWARPCRLSRYDECREAGEVEEFVGSLELHCPLQNTLEKLRL